MVQVCHYVGEWVLFGEGGIALLFHSRGLMVDTVDGTVALYRRVEDSARLSSLMDLTWRRRISILTMDGCRQQYGRR